MREIGRAILVKAPPKVSQGEKKYDYTHFGGGKSSMQVHQAKQRALGTKHVSLTDRRILAQMVENLNPRKRVLGKGVSAERMQQELRPQLVAELGEDVAEKIMRAVGLGKDMDPRHSLFAGGKRPSGEQVAERIRQQGRNISRKTVELAAQKAKGLAPPHGFAGTYGITAENIEEIAQEAEGILGKSVADSFRSAYGHQEVPAEESSEETTQREPTPISRYQTRHTQQNTNESSRDKWAA